MAQKKIVITFKKEEEFKLATKAFVEDLDVEEKEEMLKHFEVKETDEGVFIEVNSLPEELYPDEE